MNINDTTLLNTAVSSTVTNSSDAGITGADKAGKPEKDFAQTLEDAFDRVNSDMSSAGAMIKNMASGQDVDIADTMIAISKADISFRMMLQVRNKALSAYEEIMRMQV